MDQAIGQVLGSSFEAVCADAAIALKELGLAADAAILDVGTGTGKFAICLALRGYRVLTGEPSTDGSRYAGKDWAANAEKAGVRERIRFEAFDAGQMPFEAGSFDAVFFFGVLHHIDEAARGDAFREALRVSKASGVVVFFEPRHEMLVKLWAEDPDHPVAANPSDYLDGQRVRERRMQGALMDIFIYDKDAA